MKKSCKLLSLPRFLRIYNCIVLFIIMSHTIYRCNVYTKVVQKYVEQYVDIKRNMII